MESLWNGSFEPLNISFPKEILEKQCTELWKLTGEIRTLLTIVQKERNAS